MDYIEYKNIQKIKTQDTVNNITKSFTDNFVGTGIPVWIIILGLFLLFKK